MWDHKLDPLTIRATARACSARSADAFDIHRSQLGVTILKDRDGEEALIGYGRNAVRLSIHEGSLLDGPVCLTYHLSGREHFARRILALRQLDAIMRLGRVTAGVSTPASNPSRPIMLLRTLNALASHSSAHLIACSLFGEEVVARDWGHPSDYLRMQTRRLISRARRLAAGGYVMLLRGIH